MMTVRTTHAVRLLPVVAAGLLLAACGEEGPGCPAADYESHLDQQSTASGDVEVMLHHASRTCAGVGANTFHVYDVTDGGGHGAPALGVLGEDGHTDHETDDGAGDHADHSDGSGTTPPIHVHSVHAHMPAHGHGTTKAPKVDSEDGSRFTVDFQMPGRWVLELEVMAPEVTSEVQSVEFTLDVQG